MYHTPTHRSIAINKAIANDNCPSRIIASIANAINDAYYRGQASNKADIWAYENEYDWIMSIRDTPLSWHVDHDTISVRSGYNDNPIRIYRRVK